MPTCPEAEAIIQACDSIVGYIDAAGFDHPDGSEQRVSSILKRLRPQGISFVMLCSPINDG
ncbi:hypothetical protein N9O24_00465 [bacterium]|nr:hypothetical protein [bacterium]